MSVTRPSILQERFGWLTALEHALFLIPDITDCDEHSIVNVSKMAMKQRQENKIASRVIQLSLRTCTILLSVMSTEHWEAQAVAAQSTLLTKVYWY